jgi:hypothetical protein
VPVASPTAPADMCSACGVFSTPAIELATVISSPSRIHATPSATTRRVWKELHGSRSMRAGIVLRMTSSSTVAASVMSR